MIARWVPPGEKGMFVWTMQGNYILFYLFIFFKVKCSPEYLIFTHYVLLFSRWSIRNRCDIRFMWRGDQCLRMENCILRYKWAYVSVLCFMGISNIRYTGIASRDHRERENVHKRTNRQYRLETKGMKSTSQINYKIMKNRKRNYKIYTDILHRSNYQ